ncbi:MAG: hypothetical protein A3C36_04100 [Omnitrophica WOR_2 bacterium RIFCSPHIGHO2_02_FULL_52_10]|nr:MAG: hypothetical protein A3C36_04100 [Omnitrophica WOR_2 bacterium RIFCSPHIGHO2_02_FULL_52_10]
MDVNIAFEVRRGRLGRINFFQPIDLADFGGNVMVEPLKGKGNIAVFPHPPVLFFKVEVNKVDVEI